MRILFATSHTYLPQRVGGSESSTHDLCVELSKLKHEVAVVCNIEKRGSLWLKNRLLSKIIRKQFVADNLLGYPTFRGCGVRSGLKEVLNTFQPDIIVVQAGQPFRMINYITTLKKTVVLYVRDTEFDRNKENLNLNRYIGFVSNSEFTAEKFYKNFKVKSCVIPPLVNPGRYKVKKNGNAVLQIGLSSQKGIDMCFKLAKLRPDIPFICVESWPLPKAEFMELQNRAKGLKNLTILKRRLNMKDVYKLAKVLLVPSTWEEAWGRVVTEAQLSGIPVIASKRGGLPEAVGDGGIIVSEYLNPNAWEKALLKIWDDDQCYKEYSFSAFSRTQKKDISIDSLIRRFENFLEVHINSVLESNN